MFKTRAHWNSPKPGGVPPETCKSLIVLFVSEAGDIANPFHLPFPIKVVFWSQRLGREGISHSSAMGRPHEGRTGLQACRFSRVFYFWKIVGQAAGKDFSSFDETHLVSFSSLCIRLAFIAWEGRVLSECSKLWWSLYSSGGSLHNTQRNRHIRKKSDGNGSEVGN